MGSELGNLYERRQGPPEAVLKLQFGTSTFSDHLLSLEIINNGGERTRYTGDCHGKEVVHKLHTPNKMVVKLEGVEDWLMGER